MTRRTHGIRSAVAHHAATISCLFAALAVVATGGCTRQEQQTTARSAAQFAAASVTTTAAGTTTTPNRRSSGIKLDGRGGFDASEAQQNALKRAYYMRDHNNDVIKPYLPRTQPTSQPAARTSTGLGR